MNNRPPTRRIRSLDGWRGISILFVVAGHLINYRYGLHPHVATPNIARVLSNWGVALFFVISGFIITKSALSEYNTTANFSIPAFYVRRIFRIIPPFYLYLAFITVMSARGLIQESQSEILAGAAFSCNFPHAQCGWFAGHSWTLAYEEQYYLIMPLVFYCLGRQFRVAVLTLLITLLAFPFACYLLHCSGRWYSLGLFVRYFSYICAGAVISAYDEKLKRVIGSRYSVHLSYGTALLLAALLGLDSNPSFFSPGSVGDHFHVAGDAILPICFAWLIGSTAYQSNRITHVLTLQWLQFLGTISYSLYIWQEVFTAAPDLYPRNSMLIVPALMFIMAVLSYYCIERPSIRCGKRLLNWSSTRYGLAGSLERKSEFTSSAESLSG
jgi:peptidoglycan/LPS O-acetylase OafA/YrhL